jgi:hypothetical protein
MRRSSLPLIALALFVIGCDSDGDGVSNGDDCAPDNADVSPDAEEVCDGIDNNCDGTVDEGVTTTFYGDADGDGYAGATLSVEACEAPAGFFETADDCDDLSADAFPGGTEVCDDADNDCDGLVDDDDDDVDLSTAATYWADGDADGYGDAAVELQSCGTPAGYADNSDDCDDTDADINPETIWYADVDGDGYGSATFTEASCTQPDGYTWDSSDCDDVDPLINPAALEICDGGVDNDCNGTADDDDSGVDVSGFSTFYVDGDGDGYGDPGTSVSQCNAPSGYTGDWSDCDDSLADVNPGATEVCQDGLDNDCSGDAPECGFYGDIDVSTADGWVSGDASSDYLGRDMATGDWDGDGSGDVAIGAYSSESGGSYSTGQAFVYYGGLSGTMSTGSADVTLDPTPTDSYAYFGKKLANAGDVNGDTYEDLLVGAYGTDSNGSYAGTAYLYFGSASGISATADATFTGANSYDYLGRDLVGMGDQNADGYDDLAITAPYNDDAGSSTGSVYIFWGSASTTGATDAGDADIQYTGPSGSIYFGYELSTTASDLDGDGAADLITGGYSQNAGVGSYAGAAYIMYGSASAASGTYDADDAADAILTGAASSDYFNYSSRGGFDIDGDGYEDLAVHEYYNSSSADEGALYIYLGSATRMSGTAVGATEAWWTGTGSTAYDYFGRAFDSGDMNGDGNMDLAIGAGGYDGAGSSAGATAIFFGPISAGSATITEADSTFLGSASSEYVGYYDTEVDDVDGDGVDDIYVSVYGYNSSAGAVGLFHGDGI